MVLSSWFMKLAITTVLLSSVVNSQGKKTKLKVISRVSNPYLIPLNTTHFKGFVVDVLDQLAKLNNFEYELGSNVDTGPSNKPLGIVNEVANGNADLAFSDITVTPERLETVEFTYPYKTLSLATLHWKAEPLPHHEVFGIFRPFTVDLWVYIMIMCLVYCFVLFLIGRISYKDWRKDMTGKGYKNELGILSSFWFMASSIFLRTTHTTPRGFATRLLSVCFYFFSFIIVIIYISQLTVLTMLIRTVGQPKLPTVEDLVEDSGLQFGAIKDGSTHNFLQNSKQGLHQSIFEAVPESNYFESMQDAEEALRKNRNLVLIVESTSMEFVTKRQCDLTGTKIANTPRSFAIALQPKSPYNQMISKGLIEMEKSGEMDRLYHRWWSVKLGGGACAMPTGSGKFAHQLSTGHMRNICIFFGTAIVVSIVIALIEYSIRSSFGITGTEKRSFGGIKHSLKLMCTCRDRHQGNAAREENEAINIEPV